MAAEDKWLHGCGDLFSVVKNIRTVSSALLAAMCAFGDIKEVVSLLGL